MASERILILEDDEKLRTMLVHVLSAEGYVVDQASNGMQAVQLAAASEYDLVVADIRMEGINGLEALARMKESQPELRSLVMTGYSTEEDSIRAIRLGVGDYLRKPFDLDELMDSVQRLLAARRQENQNRAQEARLRRSLLRAVQASARAADLAGTPGRPPGGLEPVGGLAERLAASRGLAADAREEVQLATWIYVLQSCDPDNLGLPLEEELTPTLRRCLRHVEEHWDGSGQPDGLQGSLIPLESRLVAVAVARSMGQPLLAGQLHDPELCALDELSELEAQGESPRSLLWLAQALEAAGQSFEATHAYQQLAAQAGSSRERVQAYLGLARLSSEPAEFCRQALECSQAVGPSTTAQCCLESGLLLLGRGQSGGEGLLLQAGRLYRELQFASLEALATVALAALGTTPVGEEVQQTALELLSRAEYRDDTLRHQAWMADWLLGRASSPAAQRIVQRWLQDGSGGLVRLLRQGKLSRDSRLALLEGRSSLPPDLQAELAQDADAEVRTAALRSAPTGALPVLRIYTLGPLEVYRGDERVPNAAWRSQKTRFLLAYLASLSGRSVSEDVLIDMFWPDDADKGKRNLYWVTSILRGCLRAPGVPENVDYIARQQGMLALNSELPRWHDLEHLESLLQSAAARSGAERADALRRAVALYRGPFLEGCYMDWAELVRQRVFNNVCEALHGLAQWSLQAGRAAECLEHSQRLLELDNCRQDAALLSMQALLQLGRPEEAARIFDRTRKTLARELEMEPGLPLLEMNQRALLSLPG